MLPMLIAGAALAAQNVTLTTDDGVNLHAIAQPLDGADKGVVLVHMLNRNAKDWSYVADKLSRSGRQVISPDLRGHGENDPNGESDLTSADYLAMEGDVRAAVGWLRDHGVTEVSCAGASIGANLCLKVASADPAIVNVVMLSPGLNYKGITVGSAVAAYGDRPLLLVASDDDRYSMTSATRLEERATGQKHFELLERAGHGTKMLNRDPALEGIVMSWLLGTYQLANGTPVAPRPAVAADIKEIETTGKKLDMHQ